MEYPLSGRQLEALSGKTLHFLRIVDRHSDGIDSSIASEAEEAHFNAFLQTFYGPLNTEAKPVGDAVSITLLCSIDERPSPRIVPYIVFDRIDEFRHRTIYSIIP